jgi:cell division protein FtsB
MKALTKQELLKKIARAKLSVDDPDLIKFRSRFLKMIAKLEKELAELEIQIAQSKTWVGKLNSGLNFSSNSSRFY